MTARTLTRTEWDELCDAYKLVKPDGTHWMLSLEREGTCLVRIELDDDPLHNGEAPDDVMDLLADEGVAAAGTEA